MRTTYLAKTLLLAGIVAFTCIGCNPKPPENVNETDPESMKELEKDHAVSDTSDVLLDTMIKK